MPVGRDGRGAWTEEDVDGPRLLVAAASPVPSAMPTDLLVSLPACGLGGRPV